jgi:hypothetical protein
MMYEPCMLWRVHTYMQPGARKGIVAARILSFYNMLSYELLRVVELAEDTYWLL